MNPNYVKKLSAIALVLLFFISKFYELFCSSLVYNVHVNDHQVKWPIKTLLHQNGWYYILYISFVKNMQTRHAFLRKCLTDIKYNIHVYDLDVINT